MTKDGKVATFQQRLQQLKDAFQLTNVDIAKACGKDKSNVTKWLDGVYEGKQDVIGMLSDRYGVSPTWLMGYDVSMSNGIDLQMFAENRNKEIVLLSLCEKLTDSQLDILINMASSWIN